MRRPYRYATRRLIRFWTIGGGLRRLKPGRRDAEQKDMGARSVIAVVVCTAAATALAAVADGALVLFLDQPGQELPIATTPDPDVSATPGRPAPRPLLTAVVRAPRHTTDLAAPSELRAVVTGGTSRDGCRKDGERQRRRPGHCRREAVQPGTLQPLLAPTMRSGHSSAWDHPAETWPTCRPALMPLDP